MTFSPLQAGDTIGVFAPSSRITEDLSLPVALLEEAGFRVVIHPQTSAAYKQSAGTHAEKCTALHDLYKNPEVKAIFAAGGGNRALHLLPDINYALIKSYPKPLIGYSDVTALLNAVWCMTGQEGLHAPVLKQLHNDTDLSMLLSLLKGEPLVLEMKDVHTLNDGEATGPLIGGNLSLVQSMIGTPYWPNVKGSILLLEDVGEEYSRLDRTLCHLRLSGLFDHLSGLLFGHFTDLQDTGKKPFGFSLYEIIQEHTQSLKIPVIYDVPFGHHNPNTPLPIGRTVKIKAKKNNLIITL